MINRAFARLFAAMVTSSIGDWAGLIAVTVLVARLGGSDRGAYAVAAVTAARLVALLVFGPIAGTLVDRIDRRRLMVGADLGRAVSYAAIPFLGLPGILLASIGIEVLALLWGPSMQASLPTLVPGDQLPRANSLALLASYGTLPAGAVLFTLLTAVGTSLAPAGLGVGPEALALWLDAGTFAVSAAIVARLPIRAARRTGDGRRRHWLWEDVRDEWQLLRSSPRVTGVIQSLAVAFAAAGAVTALGPLLVLYDLGSGAAGFGLVAAGLGGGVILGTLPLLRHPDRVRLDEALTRALVVASACMLVVAASGSVGVATVGAVGLGAAGGVAWIAGSTLLQEEVEDAYRGRTFTVLTVAARLAILLSRVLFPLLAGVLASAGLVVASGSQGLSGTRVAIGIAGLLLAGSAVTSHRGRRPAS